MALPWPLIFSSGERPRALWALLFFLFTSRIPIIFLTDLRLYPRKWRRRCTVLVDTLTGVTVLNSLVISFKVDLFSLTILERARSLRFFINSGLPGRDLLSTSPRSRQRFIILETVPSHKFKLFALSLARQPLSISLIIFCFVSLKIPCVFSHFYNGLNSPAL